MTKMATASTEETLDLVAVIEDSGGGTSSLWDPCLSSDWDKEKPSQQCILRIKRFN